jgi:phosphatidyl-myo-inositol alpha-mannosyltransferase
VPTPSSGTYRIRYGTRQDSAMRVGLVSPYDYSHPGGVNAHVRPLARHLRALGHEVKVLAPSSSKVASDPDFLRVGGAYPVPVNDSVARINLNPLHGRRISEILERERFDVLHLHEPAAPMLPLTVLRQSRAAHVGTFHAFAERSLLYSSSRDFLATYLDRLHATVAVSEAASAFVRRFFPRLHPVVVPNGVDVERFRPHLPPLRHLLDGCVNFLFVGRLEERKGLRDLLDGYELASRRIARPRLIVVGGGPERREVEQIVRGRGLRNVVLAGRVPDEVLPRYHASADVFCSPATGGESFGIVLVEAMAAGLPVICTDIAGYRSVVEPGVDSLTVPPHDPRRLEEAMVELAGDAERRRRMGEAGMLKARERYSWSVVSARLLEVYERARELAREEVETGVHR